ncbi:hypothetical protein MtrunA17_Chr1g0166521 [Medicago truncatula]|uniref:Uncharacterized protein n=1 Tax=Medicago truncatula TaxID=3880 RepID=A0A396JP82_MEDTR|nr:hypothetical protein MtrunA17_Chr1g0166521 [Medicago truncatula]
MIAVGVVCRILDDFSFGFDDLLLRSTKTKTKKIVFKKKHVGSKPFLINRTGGSICKPSVGWVGFSAPPGGFVDLYSFICIKFKIPHIIRLYDKELKTN